MENRKTPKIEMKLLHARSVKSTVRHDAIETRRGDLIDPFTFKLPPGLGDGPLDEVVRLTLYDGTETLELEDAATDMNDLDEIIHNGRKYRITEKRESRQYGFWDFIECTRSLTNGI
jgi:hypothetical protein